MRAFLIAAILLAAGPAFADADSNLHEQAVHAGIADVATTALGLAAGAAEANPLGAALSIGLKPLVLHYVATLPEEQRALPLAAAASLWSGVAVNNVCVIASILTAGGFAPACIVAGFVYGMHTWGQSERERIFWAEGCPMLRQYTGEPDLKCIYTPAS